MAQATLPQSFPCLFCPERYLRREELALHVALHVWAGQPPSAWRPPRDEQGSAAAPPPPLFLARPPRRRQSSVTQPPPSQPPPSRPPPPRLPPRRPPPPRPQRRPLPPRLRRLGPASGQRWRLPLEPAPGPADPYHGCAGQSPGRDPEDPWEEDPPPDPCFENLPPLALSGPGATYSSLKWIQPGGDLALFLL